MQCMKCGRDTDETQVFCETCRETMAKYPVKPGTVVQLPHRPQQTQRKQTSRWRPVLTTDEQMSLLRRMVRRQNALIALLLAAVIGLGWLSVKLYKDSADKVLPGQNYFTSAETTEATEATTVPAQPTEEIIAG